MKLVVTLLLAILPFVGIGLLLWKGPKSVSAVRYTQAVERREAAAAEEDLLRLQLEDEDAKLVDKQQALREGLGVLEGRTGGGADGAGPDGASRDEVRKRDTRS